MSINANAAAAATSLRLLGEPRRPALLPLAVDDGADADAADATEHHANAALKSIEMADDMAAIAAQFRSRRELEKKTTATAEGLDRVLDEQVDAKVLKLQQASAVREPSMRSLLAQARSLFPDESDLFLVLAELGRRGQLSRVQRERIGLLQQQVAHEANQRDLRGGIHCALKAKLFGTTLSVKASLLRQSYRRFLTASRDPVDHYEDWIAAYGYQARHTVLEFIQQSLACDIRASDPSCSLAEFGNLLGQMNSLRLMRSADIEFVGGLSARHLVNNAEPEAYWILGLCALLHPQNDPVGVLVALMQEGEVGTASARTQWLNAVRAACKRLPEGLRSDGALDALLVTLDDMATAYHAAERPTPGQPC